MSETIQELKARIAALEQQNAFLKQTYQHEMTRLRDDYQAALTRSQQRIEELEAILEAAQPPETEIDRLMEQHIQEVEARWNSEAAERDAGKDEPPYWRQSGRHG